MKNFGFLGIHLDSIPDDETKYYKFLLLFSNFIITLHTTKTQ